jgi:hypothetical protein
MHDGHHFGSKIKNIKINSTASGSYCWMAVFSGEISLFSTVETGTKLLEFLF